ncbi:glycosyltransferase [Halomicroarcula sp. GCM10025817]|uniref:glycosyltransferase n=1 Tax=Haloarcula TaxID=2237 RepID=UPI0023E7D3EC|nr:glycosyltransferase [Halomicroarcula sp. SYNS111]
MVSLLAVGFWLTAVLLVHVYFLYPGVLFVLGAIINRSEPYELPEDLPTVSLVIAAYNEEEIIAEKIENSLELDYPSEKLEIIVFSDASSDDTDRIVESYADQGVRLERIEGRVGKTECQNRVTERVNADIVVFSDADSMYEPQAIKRLVGKFGDDVGCVVGELCYREYGVEAESAYRTFEKRIRRWEPRVSSGAGANGSIYAVRRSSYVPLPPDHISDFSEPLAIVEQGERVEYMADARAWENTGDDVESEASRRVRIGTRSWNTFFDYLSLLNPLRYPLFSFELLSHWLLRWLSPVLLGVAALTNVALVATGSHPIYTVTLLGQLGFYALAAVGALMNRMDVPTPTVAYVPFYFLVLNQSLVLALWNVIRKRNIITWETDTRTGSE